MQESIIEQYMVKRVKAMGGWAVKLISSNAAGLPDRLVLFPKGKLVFVEIKRTGGKPRALQAAAHRKLRALGFAVEVVSGKTDADNLIMQYGGGDL